VIQEQDIVNYELYHVHLVLAEMTHIVLLQKLKWLFQVTRSRYLLQISPSI